MGGARGFTLPLEKTLSDRFVEKLRVLKVAEFE